MVSKSEIHDIVKALLGKDYSFPNRILDGRNNRCYSLESNDGPIFVKSYFHNTKDQRNRLKAEFEMVSFLWEGKVNCMPEPLARDDLNRIGIYRYLSGTSARNITLQWNDIKQLAALLLKMWSLSKKKNAKKLEPASESCTSFSDYDAIIENRLERLLKIKALDTIDEDLFKFLKTSFNEVWRDRLKPSLKRDESEPVMTISPSDHGFHNALMKSDGKWIFFDFEYAGWDDVAKMISDALHQPAVPIPIEFKSTFVRYLLSGLKDDGTLLNRLNIIHPVVGLKWCLLMLNEFIPVSRNRRNFSGLKKSWENQKIEQLELSKAKLNLIKENLTKGICFA